MRKLTGTIVPKPSGFFCRVWVPLPDGTKVREWRSLDTKDRNTAKRRLARMLAGIASGQDVGEAHAKATAGDTYRTFTKDRHEQRKASGVRMARDEQNNRERYIYGTIGDLPLARVTDDHCRQILEGARDKGLARETIHKIRAVLRRDFKRAKLEKLIAASPAEDVALPDGLKIDRRPFRSLSDEQIATFLAAPKGDLEIKLLSIVARVEGGMRTAELVRWDWAMIDTATFAACTIIRAKTGEVQPLEVPEVLRPFLRAWWTRAGQPVAGPVFPVRRGKRVGESKRDRGTSFAHRLRRDLFRAGVVMLPPVLDPKTKKLVPNPADPIYNETPVSRRVTFHSFRRAYDRALARAGVNMQTAMTLSGHSDERVHMRYVRELDAARPVPVAALPALDPGLAARLLSPAVTIGPSNDVERVGKVLVLPERDTSLELATFGLGSDLSILQVGAVPQVGSPPWDPRTVLILGESKLLLPELAPAGDSKMSDGQIGRSAVPPFVDAAAEAVRAMLAVRDAFADAES